MLINEFSVTEFTPMDRLKQNRTTLSTELALGLRRAITERTSLALEFSYSQFMAPIAHTDYYAFSSRAVGFNFIITQDLKFKR
jgi:hypothetical protein